MKQSILIIIFIILFKTGFAQQNPPIIKYSFKGKTDPFVELQIYGTAIYIEGYDGDELTIEPYNIELSKAGTEDAPGLTNITSIVQNDPINGGSFGTPVIKEYPQQVQISMTDIYHKALLIKLPRNIHLKLVSGSMQSETRMISLKDLTGELEISGAAAITELNNITGPLTFSSNAIYSSKIIITKVKWNNNDINTKRTSLNISCYAADIDISIPENIKATVNINTTNGEIYSDLNMVRKYPASNALNNFSGDLNGGGIPIIIITNYGNVFLRKQQ